MNTNPTLAELGKSSEVDHNYNPKRLFAIDRATKRKELGITERLPFYGIDIWNHYEVSWLNPHGKPIVATAEIRYDCSSPNLVESKSLKLYFNSLNHVKFSHQNKLAEIIQRDLSDLLASPVDVTLSLLTTDKKTLIPDSISGIYLDDADVVCEQYLPQPNLLKLDSSKTEVQEALYSHLLRSNCPVTNQPDWGSILIEYQGSKINHEALLQYIISYRDHNEFHEQCIERIYLDIWQACQPKSLSVYGRYTRRGGIDINPYRSSTPAIPEQLNQRLARQ